MQVQHVDVVISPDGDVRLEVRGVKGPNCLKLTEALEQSLGGDVVARQQTPEYQEQAIQEEQRQQWRIGGTGPAGPPATRVLSQLITGQHEALLQEAGDHMPALLAAGRDFDRDIAANARRLLTGLKSAPAQQALCRTAIQQNDPTAFEIARQCGYLPEDPAWKALYYFITDDWDAYQAIDFDQRYLQSLYPHLTDEAKRVLIAKIRKAGRGDVRENFPVVKLT